jgi:hypothetical protein
MGRTKTIIGLAAVFVVAFAGTAVANHIYNDVSTNNVFHDEIAEIGEQGCAEGFPGGLFKPEDPVKRQQMARFLSRCGTRVASNSGSVADVTIMPTEETNFADVNVQARADGLVVLIATGNASADDASTCPCGVVWSLTDGTTYATPETRGEIPAVASELSPATTSMAMTGVFSINQGEERTYSIRASTSDNNASVDHQGRLVALFVPFAFAPIVN